MKKKHTFLGLQRFFAKAVPATFDSLRNDCPRKPKPEINDKLLANVTTSS